MKLLNSFLMILVGKLQSGAITRSENEMVRAIISAIGVAGNPSSRVPLRSLLAIDAVTNAVKQLANDVLAKLPAQ